MRKAVFIAVALSGWPTVAAAETAYVTDSLRLGLHAAPDTSDRPFENLQSGTAVEVLERNPNYARVRLGDGREGWVKATFLVALKPAAARLGELEAEMERLNEAAAAAKTAQATAEQELARYTAELQARTGSAETVQETVERLQQENRAHEQRLEAYRYALPMTWVIPALVVVLVAGFAAGLWWLDALIRRRHGGFRVY
ncbi:MAG TPA: TIGR04211 family SH3 domain-containing protein [Gammaproteobacteria bacterium]|nr:TIGR04211 family SH3 domain-containing protein [Gammaproteobacteria bacterium]